MYIRFFNAKSVISLDHDSEIIENEVYASVKIKKKKLIFLCLPVYLIPRAT